MSDYTDRLLDASLKEYSRVAPPAVFAMRERRPRATWVWLLVPAVAAAVAVVVALHPTPMPRPASAPTVASIVVPAPGIVVHKIPVKHVRATVKPAVHYRTLTGVEIAKLEMLPALFAPGAEDKPIVALEITPLESANPIIESKENQ